MTRTDGLSLVELLVALVILGVALVAFAFSQVGALRASSRSALVTEAKAAANRVLEEKTTEVLRVATSDDSSYDSTYTDSTDTAGTEYSFYFHDYYYRCPSDAIPTSGRSTLRSTAGLGGCSGSTSAGAGESSAALDGVENIDLDWVIGGRSGRLGEGIMDIVVTAEANSGSIVTVGTTITCYDIFPAPTKNAPEPCPETPGDGTAGGR